MELSSERLDLLRAVSELESRELAAGTKAIGQRLLEIRTERGGPYSWFASAPWHGTHPHAEELEDAGLLEVHFGTASYRHWDQPVERTEQHWLRLTEAGRQALSPQRE